MKRIKNNKNTIEMKLKYLLEANKRVQNIFINLTEKTGKFL